jgi:hypothetical protein
MILGKLPVFIDYFAVKKRPAMPSNHYDVAVRIGMYNLRQTITHSNGLYTKLPE